MRGVLYALACCCWAAGPLRGQLSESPEVVAGEYRVLEGVPYRAAGSPRDTSTRRYVDFYLPVGVDTAVATVVYFHGGGFTSGGPHLPPGLERAGVAVAMPSYRLSPAASVREIVADAAAATALVLDTIAALGGRPDRVFVSGHSAGGYLASMLGMDSTYLFAEGYSPRDLAGVVPLSGHAVTHFTERDARGIPGERIVADSLAPIYFVREDSPPMLLITGDRDLELLGRYEENAFFWRMMQVAGHPDCELLELEGYGHGMIYPAVPLLLAFVRSH